MQVLFAHSFGEGLAFDELLLILRGQFLQQAMLTIVVSSLFAADQLQLRYQLAVIFLELGHLQE